MHLCMTENASQEPANDNDRHGQDSDGCNFDRPVSRCCLQFVFLFITVEKYFFTSRNGCNIPKLNNNILAKRSFPRVR